MTASESLSAVAPPAVEPTVERPGNGNGRFVGRRGRFISTDADPAVADAPEGAAVPDGMVAPGDAEQRGADRPKKLTRRERKKIGRLRARKVGRVVRHVDPWSVLKVSLIFYFCLFIVLMVAGVVLWNLAAAAGTISDIEGFFKSAGAFETFSFDGFVIFRATFLIGLILVVAGTGINVLLAVLFNLVSDLVGGVRFTVIEEETARPVVAEVNARR